ncbi:MAG: carbohydrate ABC transporter substrate-binding protein [Clostridia bacterium]|nr:carbohydrate ABC transporter substrate-binding protein [Clostridia bacterium]
MKFKRALSVVFLLFIIMNQLAGCNLKISRPDNPSGEISSEVSDETTIETTKEATEEYDPNNDEIQNQDTSDEKNEKTEEGSIRIPIPIGPEKPSLVPISEESKRFVCGVESISSTFSGKRLVFYAAETWGHPLETRRILYPQLKTQYNLTVNVKPSIYLRDTLQVVQETKARKQIDLVGVGYEKIPSVYSIMRPLNGKINLAYAPKGLNQTLMNEMKKGNDIMYLPQRGSEGIAYNVEKFKKAGLEEPYDLQVKGQWTWEKFAEYAKFFTEDKDKDGNPEKWGFGCWERTFHEFAMTNNTGYYTYNADGTVTSNITSDAVIQSMNFVKNLYTKDKAVYLFKGTGNYPEFYSEHSVAMMKFDVPNNPQELVYGMVGMPKGPNPGSENIVTTYGVGYGLPATMLRESNEKAALLLLAIMYDYNMENTKNNIQKVYGTNSRWKEMYETVYGGKTPSKMLIFHGVGNIQYEVEKIEKAIKSESEQIDQIVQNLEATFEKEAKNAYTVAQRK